MKVKALRNLGRGWPTAKEGQLIETTDEIAAELIAASLAEPATQSSEEPEKQSTKRVKQQ